MEINSGNNLLNVVDTTTSFKFRDRSTQSTGDIKKDQSDELDSNPEFILRIEHSQYTDVEAVGLQVWSGALLLSDYVIHEGNTVFRDTKILELSSGTGFVSIIASMFCKHIMCTDIDDENILKTIHKNFEHNKRFVKASYSINNLNFFENWSTNVINFIERVDIVLVSEIIYDDDITNGFIENLNKLFSVRPALQIYMTVEKRYVFTLANLRVEAVHYDYFFRKINELHLTWNLQKLENNFPQYFFEYERNKELELWKISLG